MVKIIKKNPDSKFAFSLIEFSIVIIIVGLVIASIVAGKAVISSARFASVRNLTNNSPVNFIEDLALWLETTQSKSFDSTINPRDPQNKPIALWKDINPQIGLGSGLNVSQSVSSQMPILKADIINGLPAIFFDGSGDVLSIANIPVSSLAKPQEVTIFIITKFDFGSWYSVLGFGEDTLGVRLAHSYNPVNNLYMHFGDSSTWGNGYHMVQFQSKPIIVRLMAQSVNSTTTDLSFAINSSKDTAGNSGRKTTRMTILNTSQSKDFAIGKDITNNAYATFYCGELIIFKRALSDSEISQVETYLSQKWRIQKS